MMLLIALSLGEAPDGVRPALAPADAVARFAEVFPDRPPLACSPLLPEHASLCYRVWEDKGRRWVTAADLEAWGVTAKGLQTKMTEQAKPFLKSEPHEVAISDMGATYWTLLDGDGWAVAPFLHGALLAERVGGEGTRVAQPRTGVFLAWKGGSAEVDRVMAVAVREMFEGADDAVTPMVHVWKAGRFVPFGQAKPRGG